MDREATRKSKPLSTSRRQYQALLRLIRRYSLSGTQQAMALILFFNAPVGFCAAARFVWHVRQPPPAAGRVSVSAGRGATLVVDGKGG